MLYNSNLISNFITFKENQTQTIRGKKVYYDVKGYYKYLNELELFDYYIKNY